VPTTVTTTSSATSNNGHYRLPPQQKQDKEEGIPSKSKEDSARNGMTTRMNNPLNTNSIEKDSNRQYKVDGMSTTTDIDDEMGHNSETEALTEQTSNGSFDTNHKIISSNAGSGTSSVAAKAIMACVNYSFCSVSMILVNKSLASR
jgi:hypothetical protein